MPKQINTYTFGQALVRKFGLKGRFQPYLDETIVPVTIVDSSLAVRIATGGRLQAASGAGNQNRILMSNPTTDKLITIRRWWAVSGTPLTDFVVVSLNAGVSGGTGFQVWRDARIAGFNSVTFQGAVAAAAVLGAPQYRLGVDSKVWEQEWIIPPNFNLEWRQNDQNTTLAVGVDWEETIITASLGA